MAKNSFVEAQVRYEKAMDFRLLEICTDPKVLEYFSKQGITSVDQKWYLVQRAMVHLAIERSYDRRGWAGQVRIMSVASILGVLDQIVATPTTLKLLPEEALIKKKKIA